MKPTDRLPWTYRGQPASGGLIRPRDQLTPNHPTHKGRLYVVGYGWLWIAGWSQANGSIRLAADPMTSDQVDTYCGQQLEREARPAPAGQILEPHWPRRSSKVRDEYELEPQAQADDKQLAGHASPSRAGANAGGGVGREPARGSHRANESLSPVPGDDFNDDIPF